MKTGKAINFYFNEPRIYRARPDVARLKTLHKEGLNIRYTTAEDRDMKIPDKFFPCTAYRGKPHYPGIFI